MNASGDFDVAWPADPAASLTSVRGKAQVAIVNSVLAGTPVEGQASLRSVDSELQQARGRDAALAQAQRDEPARFERFAQRIAALGPRLDVMRPRVVALSREQQAVVQELAVDHPLFVMDRKGMPIREQVFEDNPCFLLTDHIPMPKNTFHTLERLGTKNISLGSKMLFASQCVVLIHHELDQR